MTDAPKTEYNPALDQDKLTELAETPLARGNLAQAINRAFEKEIADIANNYMRLGNVKALRNLYESEIFPKDAEFPTPFSRTEPAIEALDKVSKNLPEMALALIDLGVITPLLPVQLVIIF